jgi:hypothetical protein
VKETTPEKCGSQTSWEEKGLKRDSETKKGGGLADWLKW